MLVRFVSTHGQMILVTHHNTFTVRPLQEGPDRQRCRDTPIDSSCLLRRTSLKLIGKDDSALHSRRDSECVFFGSSVSSDFRSFEALGVHQPCWHVGMDLSRKLPWAQFEQRMHQNASGRKALALETTWDLQPTPEAAQGPTQFVSLFGVLMRVRKTKGPLGATNTGNIRISVVKVAPYPCFLFLLLLFCNLKTTQIRVERETESWFWSRIKLLRETWRVKLTIAHAWKVPCWLFTFATAVSAWCVRYWWWRWLLFFLL